MESVMPSNMAPAYYFYTPEQTPDARRHGSFVPQPMPQPMPQAMHSQPTSCFYAMPPTPTYSRPSSSSSQPQPVLMGQQQHAFAHVYAAAPVPVVGSNARRSVAAISGKQIVLETDFIDGIYRLPSTPPLSSTASSTIGSPSACDMLTTPLNPMFSGFDSTENAAKDARVLDLAAEQLNAATWNSCASPPFTPVFIQSQQAQSKTAAQTPAALNTADLLSVSACPSLSPSPSHSGRLASPDQDNDFCDPRNLTVSGSETSLSPSFSIPPAENDDDLVLNAAAQAETPAAATETPAISAVSPVTDFVTNGLPIVEEFPELETSDEDFVNTLVNLGADYSSASSIAGTPDLSIRSRASSSATTHSELEFFDSWETSFGSSTTSSSISTVDLEQPIKRQRTSSGSFPIMDAASLSATPQQDSEAAKEECFGMNNEEVAASGVTRDSSTGTEAKTGSDAAVSSSSSTASSGTTAPMPLPTNRRGRKQSLTEDPSKIFACDLCNRKFRRQEHLKRHYRSLHTQDKPFNCHECGKKFSRSDNLAQHARTHGAGALVMNVFDDPELVAAASGSFMPPHMMYASQQMPIEDYTDMGRVLFQVAAEAPGSASEPSSDDGSSQSKKKRKRSE